MNATTLKVGHRGQKRPWAPLWAAALALGLVATSGTAQTTAAKAAAKAAPGVSTGIEPGAKRFEDLDAKQFAADSENITHAWWPLKPGMQWTYEGYVEEDGQRIPHRIIFTVTDLVKEIAGVRARVIFDTDISKGKMEEQELTFFAQDKVGNIWHLGQYRETYDTEFVGGRIWTEGNPAGAKAGIMVPANPKLGDLSFSQGYAPPPFNWTDRGRVYQTGQKVKVPAGSYDDVLVFEEFDAEHPGALQLKYYAKGVGNVKVGVRGKSAKKELMELVKVTKLSASELEAVRNVALALEKRGAMYPMQKPLERVAVRE